ncbi:hypothetical protein F5050DRAFT_1793350 [Lentinula boryana]|uniref:DUF300-domain-containing protein n=1 Tax=Lentinula boryana TaxID=40481 RepID=A0ABQ8PYP1_9AGAR|nr:hypothetical protein F5050DRAFT_1793350 [Lentinula boryana]
MLHLLPFRSKNIVLRSVGLLSLAVTSILQVWMFSTSKATLPPAYSINHFFLYFAFAGNFGVQLWWLIRTPTHSSPAVSESESAKEDAEPLLESSTGTPIPRQTHLQAWDMPAYLPYYIASNICTSVWATACHQSRISMAQAALFSALILQLRVVLSAFNNPSQRANVTAFGITLLVSKIYVGILVMYLWRTWGFIDHVAISPAFEQQVHSGVVLVLLTVATGPDPTVGLAFIYVLLSLYFGTYQNSGWHHFFLIETIVLVALLVLDLVIIKLGFKANRHRGNDMGLPTAYLNTISQDNEPNYTPPEQHLIKDDIPMLPLHRQDIS